MTRNDRKELGCDEKLFKTVVKTSFNQRRKTLRNSMKPLLGKRLPGLRLADIRQAPGTVIRGAIRGTDLDQPKAFGETGW